MPKRETLLTLEKVTDCETGDYRVGEIDFGIKVGALEDYLMRYGYEGKREIMNMMSYLIYEIERRYRDLPNSQGAVAQVQK